MRGLKQDRSASVIIAGHAFIQNIRRGHYELAVEEPTIGGWWSRSTNWSWRSDPSGRGDFSLPWADATQQCHPIRPSWSCQLHPATMCREDSTTIVGMGARGTAMSAERPEAGVPARPSPDASVAPEPEVVAPSSAEPTLSQHTVEPTRTGMVWTMVGIGVILLFAILVFILQDGQRVRVRFLMVNGTLPLGAALLFAALLGALLVLVVGAGAGAAATGGVAAPSPRRPAAQTPTARHSSSSLPDSGSSDAAPSLGRLMS
jgi:uncharacterized integral membrane protein